MASREFPTLFLLSLFRFCQVFCNDLTCTFLSSSCSISHLLLYPLSKRVPGFCVNISKQFQSLSYSSCLPMQTVLSSSRLLQIEITSIFPSALATPSVLFCFLPRETLFPRVSMQLYNSQPAFQNISSNLSSSPWNCLPSHHHQKNRARSLVKQKKKVDYVLFSFLQDKLPVDQLTFRNTKSVHYSPEHEKNQRCSWKQKAFMPFLSKKRTWQKLSPLFFILCHLCPYHKLAAQCFLYFPQKKGFFLSPLLS